MSLTCCFVLFCVVVISFCVVVGWLSCRSPEAGLAAAGGASDPGGDVGGGGAERLSGVPAGGAETAGRTGRPGPGGAHDDQWSGPQLHLKHEETSRAEHQMNIDPSSGTTEYIHL